MPPRDPLTYQHRIARLDTLKTVFKENSKRPFIGVTQGGSSRKHPGAKPAATVGLLRQPKNGVPRVKRK